MLEPPTSYASPALCRLKPFLPFSLHEMADHLLLSVEWSMTRSHCWYCINHYCTSELPIALKSWPFISADLRSMDRNYSAGPDSAADSISMRSPSSRDMLYVVHIHEQCGHISTQLHNKHDSNTLSVVL